MKNEFLQPGDIIQLKEGHTVSTDLPLHCTVHGQEGNFSKSSRDIVTIGDIHSGLDTSFLVGNYVVTETSFEGGSVGPTCDQTYPDGHHVFCSKIYAKGETGCVKVDFYQSGCFKTRIEDIKPTGKATKTSRWDIPDNLTT